MRPCAFYRKVPTPLELAALVGEDGRDAGAVSSGAMERGFYKAVSFQVGADSSPQIGEDYFVVREELVRVVPHKGWQHNPLSCLRIASRTKPLTSIGWGETGLAKKHTRMSHCVWLDAGEQHHADYRRQTKQCFADQGTEKALWSCPNILGLDTTEDIITRLNNGEMQLDEDDLMEGVPHTEEANPDLCYAAHGCMRGHAP